MMEEGSAGQRCPWAHCHCSLDLLPLYSVDRHFPPEQLPDPSSLPYRAFHKLFVVSCNTSGTTSPSFATRFSLWQVVLSSGVQVRIPTLGGCDRFHIGSTSTCRPVHARSPAFLVSLVFGCVRRRGTICRHVLKMLAPATRAQHYISNSRIATNSHIRGTGIGLLSWLRPAEVRSRSVWQHQRRMDTSGPF